MRIADGKERVVTPEQSFAALGTHVLMITNHGVHEWEVTPGLPDTGGQNVYVNEFTAALIAAGYRIGCMMVEVKKDGSAEVAWQNKVMQNHHGGVVKVGDYLYGHADRGWVCQKWDDGSEVWRERGALRKGAVHYADGMLYCVEEGSGTVALVEASEKGFKEASRFTLNPQSENRSRRGKIWVHPVVLDGRLFLRDQEFVYCFDVKGKATKKAGE